MLQRPPNSRKISGGEQCEHYGGFTGALREASIRQRWCKNAVHESSKLKPLLTKKIEAVKTNRFGGKTSLQKSCRVITTAYWQLSHMLDCTSCCKSWRHQLLGVVGSFTCYIETHWRPIRRHTSFNVVFIFADFFIVDTNWMYETRCVELCSKEKVDK